MTLTEQELRTRLDELGPFHHDVELPFGLRTVDPRTAPRTRTRTRVDSLVRHAFPRLVDRFGGSLAGLRVLDVGCNAGGFAFAAADHGAAEVVGVDVVDRYIDQAELIKAAKGLDQVTFRRASVEEVAAGDEVFDVTFLFGILYHLQDPVSTVRQLASLTRRAMVVDTNVFASRLTRRPLWNMRVRPAPAAGSIHSTTDRWRTEAICEMEPNPRAVAALLGFAGFRDVTRLRPVSRGLERRYYTGRRVTFLAAR